MSHKDRVLVISVSGAGGEGGTSFDEHVLHAIFNSWYLRYILTLDSISSHLVLGTMSQDVILYLKKLSSVLGTT